MHTLAVKPYRDCVPNVWESIVRHGSEQTMRAGIEMNVARATKALDEDDPAMQ